MKSIITAVTATLFAAGVSAADLYHGIDQGNSDLSTQTKAPVDVVGVQPGIGDNFDIYSGLANGNTDLFKASRSDPSDSGNDPDIYQGVAGNPDLNF